MKAVWKYPIEPFTPPQMQMQAGAQLLHVAIQGKTVCIWALVDTLANTATRKVYVVGTGHEWGNPTDLVYVGTVQLPNEVVLHVFDGGEV